MNKLSPAKRALLFIGGFIALETLVVIVLRLAGYGLPREEMLRDVAVPPRLIPVVIKGVNLGGVNVNQAASILIVDVVLLALGIFVWLKSREVPARLQALAEIIVEGFEKLCADTLGLELGRRFLPFVGTLFMFIWLSNLIGLIPFVNEPTKYLSGPMGLGIICFFVAHITAIRMKGLGGYLKGYVEPIVLFAPLNVIGEAGKFISHVFRLFGNIMGGSVIIAVVSVLLNFVFLPVPMGLFFGLFSGTVQAFVFTMLALVYITVLAT